MERLFTESEWRAIERVEYFSEDETMLRSLPGLSRKRLLGPTYESGEYFIGFHIGYWPPGREGPPPPYFFVYEATSELIFCGQCESREKALKLAHERISRIPPDYFEGMLAKARADREKERRERAAREQARIAEEKAKAERKLKKISKRARAVFAASEGKCHYCGCELSLAGKWHIEHKLPRALFGGSEQSNLVAACVSCNMKKRDKTDLEFQAQLAANSNDMAQTA